MTDGLRATVQPRVDHDHTKCEGEQRQDVKQCRFLMTGACSGRSTMSAGRPRNARAGRSRHPNTKYAPNPAAVAYISGCTARHFADSTLMTTNVMNPYPIPCEIEYVNGIVARS